MEEPNSDYEDITLRSRTTVDYKMLLLFHINRLSGLSCFIPKFFADPRTNMTSDDILCMTGNSLLLGTKFFESMLAPYVDKEYVEEMKKLNKGFNESDDTDNAWAVRNICMDKLTIIMKLMARKNLLLEEKREVNI